LVFAPEYHCVPEYCYSFGFSILPRQFIERAIFLRSSGDIFMETLCAAPDYTALRRVSGSRPYIIRFGVKLSGQGLVGKA
jgi:hypothetical protein